MWLFSTPKNYSEMIEKISKSVFAISFFTLYILSCANSDFDELLLSLSFGTKYDMFGLTINLSIIYIPLIMGLAEHIFKIHDRLSDILRIRKRYDRKYIAYEILKSAGYKVDKLNCSDNVIATITKKTFYEYASSTSPKIDVHYIHLALNEWCWYWITLDTVALIIVICFIFLVAKFSWLNLLLAVWIFVFISLIMYLMRVTIRSYTKNEIQVIISDTERMQDIQKEIKHALQHK